MKIPSVFFLFFVMCISCREQNEPVKSPFMDRMKVSGNKNDLKLPGEWGIYVTKTEWMGTSCNACPTLTFYRGATIRKPSGETEFYTYHLAEDTIFFAYHGAYKSDSSGLTLDRQYLMIFTETKDFTELELKHAEKKYSYILRQ